MASRSSPIYSKSQSLSLETQTFLQKDTLDFHKITSPRLQTRNTLDNPEINSLSIHSTLFKSFENQTTHKADSCNCPHVLVADDDAFQHLYYQSLFQKSLDFDGIYISREELRVHLCFSGEELIKKFLEIKECSCNGLLLIITDYQMGPEKLDGVKTSIHLRDVGYVGPLILRTSETQKYLEKQHDDFCKLMELKVINDVLDKSDIQSGKETIQTFLQKVSKDYEKHFMS